MLGGFYKGEQKRDFPSPSLHEWNNQFCVVMSLDLLLASKARGSVPLHPAIVEISSMCYLSWLLKRFYFLFHFVICVYVYVGLCEYICTCVYRCLQRPKEDMQSLRAGIRGICEPPYLGAEIGTPAHKIEQQVL